MCRVFDQYEINIEITKHRHSYLTAGIESPPELDYQEFGLWDAIYNLGLTQTGTVLFSLYFMSGIVPTLVGAKKWKPDKEELEKELKKLGIPKEEFKLSKLANEIYLDPCDPVENVNIIK